MFLTLSSTFVTKLKCRPVSPKSLSSTRIQTPNCSSKCRLQLPMTAKRKTNLLPIQRPIKVRLRRRHRPQAAIIVVEASGAAKRTMPRRRSPLPTMPTRPLTKRKRWSAHQRGRKEAHAYPRTRDLLQLARPRSSQSRTSRTATLIYFKRLTQPTKRGNYSPTRPSLT